MMNTDLQAKIMNVYLPPVHFSFQHILCYLLEQYQQTQLLALQPHQICIQHPAKKQQTLLFHVDVVIKSKKFAVLLSEQAQAVFCK